MTRAGYSVETFNDLRAIPPSRRSRNAVRFVGQKDRWFYFDPDAIEADNNDTIIAPVEGGGRWKQSPSGDGGNGIGNESGNTNATIVNSKPNTVPTQMGQWVVDSRSDRGIIWVATGTTVNDWTVFGSRPIFRIAPYAEWFFGFSADPNAWVNGSNIQADFSGQLLHAIFEPNPEDPPEFQQRRHEIYIGFFAGLNTRWRRLAEAEEFEGLLQ